MVLVDNIMLCIILGFLFLYFFFKLLLIFILGKIDLILLLCRIIMRDFDVLVDLIFYFSFFLDVSYFLFLLEMNCVL